MSPDDPNARPLRPQGTLPLPRPLSAPTDRASSNRRLRQFGVGLGLCVLGAAVLVALLLLPTRLDALLLVSAAISNLIAGLSRLGLALLQVVGLVLLVAVALAGLLCLAAGAMRIRRALWPPARAPQTEAGAQPWKRSSQ